MTNYRDAKFFRSVTMRRIISQLCSEFIWILVFRGYSDHQISLFTIVGNFFKIHNLDGQCFLEAVLSGQGLIIKKFGFPIRKLNCFHF